MGDNDNPEVSDLLKTAICCLKERPVLFKYCAEEVRICLWLLIVSFSGFYLNVYNASATRLQIWGIMHCSDDL